MSQEQRKALLVGANGYERTVDGIRVDCCLWEQLQNVTNIRDYDTLLLNLIPLRTPKARANVNWFHFHELFSFEATSDILMHKGRIVILGDPRFVIPADSKKGTIYTADKKQPFLQWTGITFQWDDQPGDTKVFNSSTHPRAEEFIKHLKKWDYSLGQCRPNRTEIETHVNVQRLEESGFNLEVIGDYFCQNRYQHAVAFSIRLNFSHQYKSPLLFNWLVFLPAISLEEDATLQLVLRDFCEIETSIPEPDWISVFAAPGQREIDANIESINASIRKELTALEATEAKRADVRQCLKLLYEREFELEPVVRNILQKLGAIVEEPIEKNKEDGWVTVKAAGQTYEGVLEIKSTKSDQFGEDGRKQLLDWIDRGRTQRGKNYKGIFIGNSAVKKAPDQRPDPFSDSWKKAAPLSQIAAITTVQLYRAYELHCEGQLNVDEFWRLLFTTNGVFDLSTLLPKPSPII